MNHADPQDYGDFAHFRLVHEPHAPSLELRCGECGQELVAEWDPQSVNLADIVKAAARHEEDMNPPVGTDG